MSRVPSTASKRSEKLDKQSTRVPLKDTSKNFVNSITNQRLHNDSNNSIINSDFRKTQTFIKPLDPVAPSTSVGTQMHAQQLTSGDRVPNLVDCSTPKKDGQVPYLTSNTINTALDRQASMNATTQSTGQSDQQRQIVAKKMTGNELFKWQQTWRDIMPKSYIFFEQVDPADNEQRKAILALKRLGATIELFFNENITIIVSRRSYDKNITYPPNDIFRYADKKQLKIWTIDKVFRFLNHLGEPILKTEEYENEHHAISTATQTNNNNNLSNMLMNEKLFGPSDRDPSAKRSDFKYFSGFFLYIWDFTLKTRPVAIREWKDKSYPKMNPTTNGKSLFSTESKSQNTISLLKRHLRRFNYLRETAEFRQELIAAAYKVKLRNGKLVSIPTYEERCAYMKKWEQIAFSSNPSSKIDVKLKDLYNSLNSTEREPFKEMFEDSDLNEFAMHESTTGLIQEHGNDVGNDMVCIEDLEEEEEENIDIDNDDVDDEEEEGEVDEECLKRLISDKSDDIDKINPAIKSSGLNKLQKNEGGIKIKPINAIPKLLRQDSTLVSNSNTNGVDGKMREYGEITASGVQASGINPSGTGTGCLGNGLAPSKSSVVNKMLANESKRIIVLSPTNSRAAKRMKISSKESKELNVFDEVLQVKESSILPDDVMREVEIEHLKAHKLSANEDELAALRSVEAKVLNTNNNSNNINPFISEGLENNQLNEHSKNQSVDIKNKTTITNGLAKEAKKHIKTNFVNEKNTIKCVDECANAATIGVFKKQKHEKGKHEMKPGYCENCRVKYSDFSDHVETEKHRSFAENDLNFKQIDNLIELLYQNRHKHHM
ncbi:hypothetical protein CANINC_004666 [Pichia inconspicua]|uniref:DBF4-type domain-containing protein n=1 Tax=Pichia inconspicua TaxID=52247 RepID=A0A4T0WW17_9ASCO|nr:hypothetical protein CANINC_004666 [[Candida] inconspicua]